MGLQFPLFFTHLRQFYFTYPVPSRWKDEKEQLHVVRQVTPLLCLGDVIMLCRNSAQSGFPASLFNINKMHLMVSKKKSLLDVLGRKWKTPS